MAKKNEDLANKYMTVVALQDNTTVKFSKSGLQYSRNGSEWFNAGTSTITLQKGEKVMFKGNMVPSTNGIGKFKMSGSCNLEGNCFSLILGDSASNNVDLSSYTKPLFYDLFSGCTAISKVSEDFLPATTLSNWCYDGTFYGCTNLIQAPNLLASHVPPLAYEYMFYNCKNLSYIKMMAKTLEGNGQGKSPLNKWVTGVASTGTFVKSKDATWDATGESGVPSGWTILTE